MTDVVADLKMAFNEVNAAVTRAAAQQTSTIGALKTKLDELSVANARASSDADIEAIIQQMHGLASSVNATTDAMVAVLPPLMEPSVSATDSAPAVVAEAPAPAADPAAAPATDAPVAEAPAAS